MKKQYVVGFLFDVDANIVTLIQKVKPKWQKGKLNGLGGHIEEGETPLAAMVREFREESGGYDITAWEHFATLEGMNYQMYCYRAWNDVAHTIYYDGVEGVVCPWSAPLADGRNCVTNLRWLLPMAVYMPEGHRDLPYYIQESPRTGELAPWDM